jgi:hypothetical protein
MSPDEATKYICQTYNPPWPGSDIPMYDSEGYQPLPAPCVKQESTPPCFAISEDTSRPKLLGVTQRD